MCPMADKMIKNLQAKEPVDLRWTRSLGAASALSFEGDEQGRKFIEKPWAWMSVDRLPRSILWRGRNPSKAFT
jgi:hypothetical protein